MQVPGSKSPRCLKSKLQKLYRPNDCIRADSTGGLDLLLTMIPRSRARRELFYPCRLCPTKTTTNASEKGKHGDKLVGVCKQIVVLFFSSMHRVIPKINICYSFNLTDLLHRCDNQYLLRNDHILWRTPALPISRVSFSSDDHHFVCQLVQHSTILWFHPLHPQ